MTELFECAQVERRARSDFLDAPFISWTNSNAINQNWTHLSFSLISTDFLCHASMDLELLGDPQAPTWRRLAVERRKTFALAEKKTTTCAAPDRNSGEIMLHLWIGKTYICIICISYHISTTETCETNLRLYWNYIWNYISESNMWCIVYILDMNRSDIFAIFDIFGPWRELIETQSLRAVLQPRRCFWQHTPWKKQRQRCRISKVRNDLTIWQFDNLTAPGW